MLAIASVRCSPTARALASKGAASAGAVRVGVGVAGAAVAGAAACAGAAGGAGVEEVAGAGVAGTAEDEEPSLADAGAGLGYYSHISSVFHVALFAPSPCTSRCCPYLVHNTNHEALLLDLV